MAKGTSLNIPFQPVTFDLNAQDEFIKANGVDMYHYAAIHCPIGLIDSDDIRAPDHSHSDCENGFIYKCMGVVRAAFVSNSRNNAI
jgi:hypothetical protein